MPATDIVEQSSVILKPDATRTVLKPFETEYPRAFKAKSPDRAAVIIDRILSVAPDRLHIGIDWLMKLLSGRHRNIETILKQRAEGLRAFWGDRQPTDQHKLIIGGYFTEEYSFEAAALFNPSIVPHWDQDGVPSGSVRFIMSLRGIGEGHVSSVTFRTGLWDPVGEIVVDMPSRFATPPHVEQLDHEQDEEFCLNFEISEDLSETVLFPLAPSQRQGIEDVRLVLFTEDDGSQVYYGTYTAFSGAAIRQEMFRTERFEKFDMRAITGECADSKGMALFPRKVGGKYRMLSRQDNENIWLLTSDDLYRWEDGKKIIAPEHPWEFIQLGNCGSPVEIDEGWLVITHSVGIVRNYTIGAALLDKEDPSKVLGRTQFPILRPSPEARDGYVPNVVYSCGVLVQGRRLLLPYGVADNYTTFGTLSIDDLLETMRPDSDYRERALADSLAE